MGPPTKHPSFFGLAEEIAGEEPSPPFDRFLGDLAKDKATNVHSRAVEIIKRRSSAKPNLLHREILRLFLPDRGRTARIVTTNFDKQFSKAAARLHLKIREFHAPAMPRGDDFLGIVHIHGALDEEPRSLVLTDVDFSRAYMTEGWARIFLEALFQKYTTLFIGYSHDDTLMTYLARGMSGRNLKPRFAFCPLAEKRSWTQLDIVPVTFSKKKDGNRFHRLEAGVQRWAKDCNLTLFQFEKEVEKAIATPFGRQPSKRNAFFLKLALRKRPTAEFFARHADEWRWVSWAQKEGLLKKFFHRQAVLSEHDAPTTRWLARRLVRPETGPRSSNRAVELVHENGGELSPELFLEIAREICALPPAEFRANSVSQLTLLTVAEAQRIPTFPVFLVGWLLESAVKADDYRLAEHILFAMAAPGIGFQGQFLPSTRGPFGSSSRVEPKMVRELFQLREAWKKYFNPKLAERGRGLLPIFETYIRQIFAAHACASNDVSQWGDPLSWSIDDLSEVGGANDIHDFNILVVMLRDSALAVAGSKEGLDQAQIVAWLRAGVPILVRTGICALAKTTALHPEEKVSVLIKENCLYSEVSNAKAEILRFLFEVYPKLPKKARIGLWRSILRGPRPDLRAEESDKQAERRAHRRRVDRLIAEMITHFPKDPIARRESRRLQARIPTWKKQLAEEKKWEIPRTISGNETPLSVDDLLKLDPEKKVGELLCFKQTDFMGPSRDGLQAAVGAAVKKDITWGQKLLEALVAHKAWDTDLWHGVFWANAWISWPAPMRAWILTVIREHLLGEKQVNNILFFLLNGDQWKNGPFPSEAELNSVLEICELAWPFAAKEKPSKNAKSPEQLDWTFEALNSASGRIAEFLFVYTRIVSSRKKTANPPGPLPNRVEQLLDQIVLSEGLASSRALARIGLESRYLLYRAESWFKKRILPLLNAKGPPTKLWPLLQSIFGYSPASKPMVELIGDSMIGFFPLFAKRDDRLFDQFCGWVGFATYFSPTKRGGKKFLYLFLTQLSEKQLARWAGVMGRLQADIPEDQRNRWWTAWVRNYWRDRLSGHPAAFGSAEATAMVQWALPHGRHFKEAIDLVERTPGFAEPTGYLFYEISRSQHPELHPLQTARLILFLLSQSKALFGAQNEVHAALKKMPKKTAGLLPLVARICEQLLRLGDQEANALLAELRS